MAGFNACANKRQRKTAGTPVQLATTLQGEPGEDGCCDCSQTLVLAENGWYDLNSKKRWISFYGILCAFC